MFSLRKAVLSVAPVLLLAAVVVAPALPAEAATCSYSFNSSNGYEYAGNYSGVTAVPSRTAVTSSGAEAQCLLTFSGYRPGPIDGVFGSQSQAAMAQLQQVLNVYYGISLTVDGMPGPATWPYLRRYAGNFH